MRRTSFLDGLQLQKRLETTQTHVAASDQHVRINWSFVERRVRSIAQTMTGTTILRLDSARPEGMDTDRRLRGVVGLN